MSTAQCFEFIVRSFVVSALACLAIPALRRSSHKVRRIVALAAWAVMALLALNCILPLPRLPLWSTTHGEVSGALGSSANRALLILWWAGALALLAHEVVGFLRLQKIIRHSELNREPSWLREVESGCEALGLSSTVELRWSDGLGPCAAGWFNPVILLPRAAAEWPAEMRSQVIIHELAHFQRKDLWIQAVTRVVAAVHWFNPLSFVLRRWSEAEREKACDTLVVQCRGDAVAYAESLLSLASAPASRSSAAVLTLLPHRQSQLEHRIRELFAGETLRPRKWWMFDAVLATAAILLLVACSISGPAPASKPSERMQQEVELRLSADPFPGDP